MKRLLIILIVFVITVIDYAIARDVARQTAWQQFRTFNDSTWIIKWNQRSGLPDMLYRGVTEKSYVGPPAASAKAFPAKYRSLFGIKEGLPDLERGGYLATIGLLKIVLPA
jgi:hypothetical protein